MRERGDQMEPVGPRPSNHRFGLPRWAESAFEELRNLGGVVRVGLALVEGGGRRLLFASSEGESTEFDWCHIDLFDELPLNDALGSGTKLVGLLDDLDARYASFVTAQRDAGHVAIAAVPLKEAGRVLGGFVLSYGHAQSFDPGQCAELDDIADGLTERLAAALRRPGPTIPQYVRPEGSLVVAHEFPADAAAVVHARLFLRRTLTEWEVDEDTAYNAALCLSELVTNALLHAHSGCCVQVELHQDVLRTEVHDAGWDAPWQTTPDNDQHRVGGRGLEIVAALATRWGQISGPDRAVVWFALDLP